MERDDVRLGREWCCRRWGLFFALIAAPALGCGTSNPGTGSPAADGSPVTVPDLSVDAAPDPCAVLSARLQAALDKNVADQVVPGAAAQVSVPGCAWSGASGQSDSVAATPMKITDQFFVGSITKTFTATAVVQLAGEGKLSLDDLVTKHVPAFTDAKAVTVRQLLNHTTGLYDYALDPAFGAALRANFDREWKPDELLGYAAGKPATNAPGTFHYSGTNTILAGMVIEKVTGSTVAKELRARIIGPLKLDSTYLAGFEPAAAGSLSHGYSTGTDITPYYLRKGIPTSAFTTGSMVSTLADVSRFFDALLVKQTLVSPALVAEMKTFVPTDNLFQTTLAITGYGLAVARRTTTLGDGVGNGGASAGWLSRSFFLGARQAMVTVFINSGTDDVDQTFDALIQVLAM